MGCSLSAQDVAPGLSLRKNKVVTAGMHIRSAVYEASDPAPCWRIIWRTNTLIKGGWFEVRVYSDKSANVFYDE